MATIHETTYPRLTKNVTAAALEQIYSPSEREIVWSKVHRLNTGSRLLILVLLRSGSVSRTNALTSLSDRLESSAN
ncbi:MAG: hypothetical protein ACJA0Z_004744 [Halioglobus sp.]|jgi:hypothetical protein